jgi:hypothetical protein
MCGAASCRGEFIVANARRTHFKHGWIASDGKLDAHRWLGAADNIYHFRRRNPIPLTLAKRLRIGNCSHK